MLIINQYQSPATVLDLIDQDYDTGTGPEFNTYRKTATVQALLVDEPFKVHTMEGVMEGKAGDYLMRGVEGEWYVCDHAIFKKTYEIVA